MEIKADPMGFYNRFFIQTGLPFGVLIILMIEIFVVSRFQVPGQKFIMIQVALSVIFFFYVVLCYRKAKFYIQAISLNKDKVILTYSKLQKNEKIEIERSLVSIKITKTLAELYPKHIMELVILDSSNLQGELILRQYELGYWKKTQMNEIAELLRNE